MRNTRVEIEILIKTIDEFVSLMKIYIIVICQLFILNLLLKHDVHFGRPLI